MGSDVVGRRASDACALGEATRGHYAVTRALYTGIHVMDNSALTEPAGLTSDTARLADILTCMAQLGGQIAPDICVCSNSASGAGAEATESAFLH
eukprot:542713-Amphidinium_carterae.1